TYEVEMQVKDDLPTVTAAVGHDAIACLPNAQLLGQLLRHPQHVPGQLRIAGCEIGQGCDVLPRDDQHVNRGLGVDVAKCDHAVVFINSVAGQFSPLDPAEDAG